MKHDETWIQSSSLEMFLKKVTWWAAWWKTRSSAGALSWPILNQGKDVGNKALRTCDFPQRLKFWTHQLLSIIFDDYAACIFRSFVSVLSPVSAGQQLIHTKVTKDEGLNMRTATKNSGHLWALSISIASCFLPNHGCQLWSCQFGLKWPRPARSNAANSSLEAAKVWISSSSFMLPA